MELIMRQKKVVVQPPVKVQGETKKYVSPRHQRKYSKRTKLPMDYVKMKLENRNYEEIFKKNEMNEYGSMILVPPIK
jgi:hypothetical protein